MNMVENNKLTKRTRSEKILDDIEANLRNLITEKKKIKQDFTAKLKELDKQSKENQEWFEDNWREAERIENKLILLWDYWRREVEIAKLRKAEAEVAPSEREGILKEIQKLNALNITLEQGFRKRKIDAEVVEELRKRLGVWESGDEKK